MSTRHSSGRTFQPGVSPLIVGCVLLIAAVTGMTALRAAPAAADAAAFYVAPDGTPRGDGSRRFPWDLATALAHPPAVKPGDTIWLRGGTYRGAFRSTLTGRPGAPITLRQYAGERAVIDSAGTPATALSVFGAWTTYWGFEVINSDPRRTVPAAGSHPEDWSRGASAGVAIYAPHTKVVHLVVHDTGVGIGFWRDAADSELYGNIIFYNGWDGADRGHGHGVYTQNRSGVKRVVDNIIFQQFGSGLIVYGSTAADLNNYVVEGNILFDNGGLSRTTGFSRNLLLGGNVLAQNLQVRENVTYYPLEARGSNNIGGTAGVSGAIVESNVFVGGGAWRVTGSTLENLVMRRNVFVGGIAGFSPEVYPDNVYYTSGQRPSGTRIVIRPSPYEPGRAHIAVYNFDLLPSVVIDVAEVLTLGDAFELRDVQDYSGRPVLTGIYRGLPLVVPMTLSRMSRPIGGAGGPLWRHTAPEFAAFVLIRRR